MRNISGGNKSVQNISEADADEISSLTTDTDFRNIAINTDYTEIGCGSPPWQKQIKYSYHDLKGVNYIMFPMYGILEQGIQTELTMNDISRLEDYKRNDQRLYSTEPYISMMEIDGMPPKMRENTVEGRSATTHPLPPFSSTQSPQFKSNIKREITESNIHTHIHTSQHTNLTNSFNFAHTPARTKSFIFPTRPSIPFATHPSPRHSISNNNNNNNNNMCNNSIIGGLGNRRARKDSKVRSSHWADMESPTPNTLSHPKQYIYIYS